MRIDSFYFDFYDKQNHAFSSIELDVMLSQEISFGNKVSQHPLEDGSILADAIHNQPLAITFSGVVSDLPQSIIEQAKSLNATAESIIGIKQISTSKSMRAWRDLVALWKSKTLVTITSPLQSDPFFDMVIVDIRVTLDDTQSLTFSADLQHLPIVTNIKTANMAEEVGKQSVRP